VPARPRENFEIDVRALFHVLFNGCVVNHERRQRPKLLHLTIPPARRFDVTHLRRAAVNQFLPPRIVQQVGHQAHSGWIIFDRIEEQHRTIAPSADHAGERADLQLGVRAFDQLQMAHLFDDRKIFAQIVKRARPAFGYCACHFVYLNNRKPISRLRRGGHEDAVKTLRPLRLCGDLLKS
jgi:hypothetical protein